MCEVLGCFDGIALEERRPLTPRKPSAGSLKPEPRKTSPRKPSACSGPGARCAPVGACVARVPGARLALSVLRGPHSTAALPFPWSRGPRFRSATRSRPGGCGAVRKRDSRRTARIRGGLVDVIRERVLSRERGCAWRTERARCGRVACAVFASAASEWLDRRAKRVYRWPYPSDGGARISRTGRVERAEGFRSVCGIVVDSRERAEGFRGVVVSSRVTRSKPPKRYPYTLYQPLETNHRLVTGTTSTSPQIG
ncbi:hypothetical protein SAMN05216559_1120 [Halomicrobium zhouii]|uniref:Uncharacterized protein n=1 Tax=Halomicrobium zhouii TaxID=767519 RepID=A0A1I6KN84_9EURY|nr:hypothetical protein SAMN05216559_1120 [Halomicrobium zhouii]